jgi:hypothetical protein
MSYVIEALYVRPVRRQHAAPKSALLDLPQYRTEASRLKPKVEPSDAGEKRAHRQHRRALFVAVAICVLVMRVANSAAATQARCRSGSSASLSLARSRQNVAQS